MPLDSQAKLLPDAPFRGCFGMRAGLDPARAALAAAAPRTALA